MRDNIKYFLVSVILIWFFGFLYVFSNGGNRVDNEQSKTDLWNRVQRAEFELAQLQMKNRKNEEIIRNLREKADEYSNKLNMPLKEREIVVKNDFSPSKNFEETRRKIFNDVKDVSYFINSQIDLLESRKLDNNLKSKVNFIKQNFQDRINVLIASVYNLSTIDNLGEWRRAQEADLANKVQARFLELQNPKDCQNSKKIICDLNKSCGFGCQMHHVMYCFITAFFTGRTMILESVGWRYNTQGYEAYFKPVSDTCQKYSEVPVGWNDNGFEKDVKAIKMPIIDIISGKPAFLPLSVPKEYFDVLSKFHGDPFVWWAGQTLSYLMRFNSAFKATVKTARDNLKFQNPCVGRTDKVGTEAAFHGLDEYMKHVKDFFDIYDLKTGKKNTRTVYLATDEVSVLKEARQNYKEYTFLLDETNAKTASLNQRYSPESAQGVILDIYFLSQCDYLVCTFSSQVCRMAYELMQTRYPDASWRFRSLDDVYYYGGQNGHDVMAIYDHVPNRDLKEIELKKGDLISLAGNHWNGYSKGKNKRTNEDGLFPSYKVVNVIQSF